jgi:hypothetical protein
MITDESLMLKFQRGSRQALVIVEAAAKKAILITEGLPTIRPVRFFYQ